MLFIISLISYKLKLSRICVKIGIEQKNKYQIYNLCGLWFFASEIFYSLKNRVSSHFHEIFYEILIKFRVVFLVFFSFLRSIRMFTITPVYAARVEEFCFSLLRNCCFLIVFLKQKRSKPLCGNCRFVCYFVVIFM